MYLHDTTMCPLIGLVLFSSVLKARSPSRCVRACAELMWPPHGYMAVGNVAERYYYDLMCGTNLMEKLGRTAKRKCVQNLGFIGDYGITTDSYSSLSLSLPSTLARRCAIASASLSSRKTRGRRFVWECPRAWPSCLHSCARALRRFLRASSPSLHVVCHISAERAAVSLGSLVRALSQHSRCRAGSGRTCCSRAARVCAQRARWSRHTSPSHILGTGHNCHRPRECENDEDVLTDSPRMRIPFQKIFEHRVTENGAALSLLPPQNSLHSSAELSLLACSRECLVVPTAAGRPRTQAP